MKWPFLPVAFALALPSAKAIQAPTGVVTRAGDQTLVVHWDKVMDPNLAGYRAYRSLTNTGPFVALNTNNLLTSPGFCQTNVLNSQTNYFYVTAVDSGAQESAASAVVTVVPHAFATDDEFLEYIQQVHFDYFWYLANPANGLIPDRSATGSACSIAAVGFGLTAIGIGIDHGWISRTQGVARVLTTLNTFLNQPQGPGTSGIIGYNGWFYHFLDMNTAVRSAGELSSIDTALLLGGILYAKQYFNGTNSDEANIRTMADAIYNQLNWNFMTRGTNLVSMGWDPISGFSSFGFWVGYDEGIILYILGLGTTNNPLPSSSWNGWTSGYTWGTYYGQSYVPFPPLFGHQYSHCWIDFRHIADPYMNSHNSTYFENSRRATLAQRSYCIANPLNRTGYGANVWGLTACDGPSPGGYQARGAPGTGSVDDGTIAPTAAGGSMPFAPEYCVPTLRHFYGFRRNIWTPYGFRDAFNLGQQWWGPDELGIDQGPIVIMIENYRTQKIWKLFLQNPEIQRGLQRAGFVPLSFMSPSLQPLPDQAAVSVNWDSSIGRSYQVEYSPDLETWFFPSTGELVATNTSMSWVDSGPPGTPTAPLNEAQRFYRVFQFGIP
jgi:hypothetical protein